ncbi:MULTISPECIES: SPOR domain-containing protein [unclassified Clostridium]|uniref:SPOR domain-containing protein n=1 Tax=unclassified Clostridium TaxID=2614128 RepID=UPI0002977FEC|nr:MULTISPECIES: SPOR domain-containing protein [unclassified Clostridium]EKQ55090.1 MAG: sporulation related protein [Clostridium sp. Maddingley MBC34-26]
MRYTRYEYKRSNKMKFICTVALIAGISIGGGLYLSSFIFNGKELQTNNSNSGYSTNEINDGSIQNIIVLQCGYYSKEENAKELLNSISKYCQPFIVEEDGKYRVLAGIYKQEDGLKKMDEFKSNNIEFAKVSLNMSNNDLENKELMEIIDGVLSIINKLQDSEVKSIKTAEFKDWTDKVINDGGNVKSKKIDDLNNYVKGLPEELDKSNSSNIMQELYKLIKN